MNNKEFTSELSRRLGYTLKDTSELVTSLLSDMTRQLEEGNMISIQGFGTFEVKKKAERISVNPTTKQRMLVPPKLVLTYKPSTLLRISLSDLSFKIFHIMNEKLNIQDLIDLLAEKHGMSKKNADSFVKEFFQLIEEALEKDKYVKIKGLGAFKLIDVESRESVNVNTGERFEIQGHTKVSFTPEPALKDIINKPFAHFETVVLNEGTVLEDTPVDSGSEEDEDTEQKVEDVVPEVVAGSAVETPEIAEKIDSPVEPEPVEEAVVPVETVASEEVNEERVEVIKTAGPAESSAMKYFIAIVALVVLLCAGTVAYLYYPDWFDGLSAESPVEETADNEAGNAAGNTVLMDSVGVKDSVVIAVKDTVSKKLIAEPVIKQQEAPVAVRQPVVAAATSASQPKKEKKVEYVPDSTNYTIAGTQATYTIKPGETLTRVALRFYGTKALYPYIVKHNPDVIKKPDNVPAGTTIKIPKLVKKQ